MPDTTVGETRERRGARREPKHQRSREPGCQPLRDRTAKPPPSGRNVDPIEVKHRHSQTGTVHLMFDGPTTRFSDLRADRRREAA